MTARNRITIRAANPGDAAEIAALARQLLAHEQSLNAAMGELTPWAASPEELRKQMLRPNTHFFVAEKWDEIVGYIKVVIHGLRMTRRELGTARWLLDELEREARAVVDRLLARPRPNTATMGGYIAGAFVRHDVRREHTGRLLVGAAEDWVRAHGIETVDLHVLAVNADAHHFWEEVGYEPLTIGMQKSLNKSDNGLPNPREGDQRTGRQKDKEK